MTVTYSPGASADIATAAAVYEAILVSAKDTANEIKGFIFGGATPASNPICTAKAAEAIGSTSTLT